MTTNFEMLLLMNYKTGETDVIWQFSAEDDFKKWKVSSDSDHNEGHSRCTLEPSAAGRGLFSGSLQSTVRMDGKIKRAGYCNIKTHRARVSYEALSNCLIKKIYVFSFF